MEPKPWYASRMIWFNLLGFIVAIASFFGYAGDLPEGWGEAAAGIAAIINLILRLRTSQPISAA